MKKIPLIKPYINIKEQSAVNQCLKSGWLSFRGNYVRKFESKFKKFIRGGHVLTTSNGTHSIELALLALGVKKGDEIIIPDFSFVATINAVLNIGAKPVIVDVNIKNWLIDIEKIKKNITKKTRAILFVNTYGIVNNINQIKKIVKKHKLLLIEDCAESLGSKFKKRVVGLRGDASTYSFFPNKTITTGEGGIVVFKNKKIYEKAKILRNQGRKEDNIDFRSQFNGRNFRMSNIQAAIGFEQLNKINRILYKKKKIFNYYFHCFKKNKKLNCLPLIKDYENSYWLFVLRFVDFSKKQRDNFIKKLHKKNIETRPGFFPISLMKPFIKYSKKKCINSIKLSKSTLCLPTSYDLTQKQQKYVIKTFLELFN